MKTADESATKAVVIEELERCARELRSGEMLVASFSVENRAERVFLGACDLVGHYRGSDRRYSIQLAPTETFDQLSRDVQLAEERTERFRKRASDNIDAAELRELYDALEEDNFHSAAKKVQKLANTVAELKARAERAEAVLREVEWKQWREYDDEPSCVMCLGLEKSEGHDADCALAACLRR